MLFSKTELYPSIEQSLCTTYYARVRLNTLFCILGVIFLLHTEMFLFHTEILLIQDFKLYLNVLYFLFVLPFINTKKNSYCPVPKFQITVFPAS